MLTEVYEFLKAQRDAMLGTLRTLVEHETPTDDKRAIDGLQDHLATEFAALGAHVELVPQSQSGNHLRAEFAPAAALDPQLTLLTHVDTVYAAGTLASMPFRAE